MDSSTAAVADIACDFAAAGGMAGVDDTLEIEIGHKLGKVVGVVVHVVSGPRLA